MTKQVSLNYNRAIIDYLQGATLDFIDSHKCVKGENEARCKHGMKEVQKRARRPSSPRGVRHLAPSA